MAKVTIYWFDVFGFLVIPAVFFLNLMWFGNDPLMYAGISVVLGMILMGTLNNLVFKRLVTEQMKEDDEV